MINDPRSTLKRDSASGRCARPDAICCSPDALTNGPNGTADIDTEFDLISSRGTERSPSKSAGNDIINEFDVLGSESKDVSLAVRIWQCFTFVCVCAVWLSAGCQQITCWI